MRIVEDYKKYLREFHLEEPLDFFLFRPLAYTALKLLERLPITPNQITLCAFIVAMLSTYSISTGTVQGFFWGGVGILVFSVLDCCDGMLARMKQNGSKYGDLIDMFVDLLSSIGFFVSLHFGLQKQGGEFYYLALISGVFIFVHASIFHYYKKQFLFYLKGCPEGRAEEIEKYRNDLQKLKMEKGYVFQKLLLTLYLYFSRLQRNDESAPIYDVEKYIAYNTKTLPMWGVMAGSSHLFLLSLGLIFYQVEAYFFAAIILFNVWMIIAFFTQQAINSNVLLSKRSR